mgnify:FL=1
MRRYVWHAPLTVTLYRVADGAEVDLEDRVAAELRANYGTACLIAVVEPPPEPAYGPAPSAYADVAARMDEWAREDAVIDVANEPAWDVAELERVSIPEATATKPRKPAREPKPPRSRKGRAP